MNNTQELQNDAKIGDSAKATGTRTKAQKHGLSRLIRSRSRADVGRLEADTRQIDGRCALAIAMNAYRTNLVESLG